MIRMAVGLFIWCMGAIAQVVLIVWIHRETGIPKKELLPWWLGGIFCIMLLGSGCIMCGDGAKHDKHSESVMRHWRFLRRYFRSKN